MGEKSEKRMNEKFFDLPREKQDRMINGALEVFAKNGFKHASTDDMVKAVGVSKGLWFHYFGSKAGLYIFVYEYSVKYMLLEISAVVDERENDFSELARQVELAKSRAGKNYPFMNVFLEESARETEADVLAQTQESGRILQEKIAGFLKNAEMKGVEDKARRDKIKKMVDHTIKGIVKEQLYEGYDSEAAYKEIKECLDVLKEMIADSTAAKEEEPISSSKPAAS